MREYLPTLVTPPDALVSLEEIKAHSRVVFDVDDALLASYVSAATAYLDGENGLLGYCLATQTWENSIEAFPTGSSAIELKPGRVGSVSNIQYRQVSDGSWVDLSDSDYTFYTDYLGSFVVPEKGKTWPSVYDAHTAVKVTFECGQPASNVDQDIKQAIMMLAAHFYEHREAVEVGPVQVEELPLGVQTIVAAKRLRRF